ncbi:MAG: hypothetical protein PUA75_05535 [Clostridiales bacterium]|nr:hypothetical protein [Clostridiales bacterium]
MNEIITRLNEIEEKAEAIIRDAKSGKERMLSQLEADEREIDRKYEALEQEKEEHLRQQISGENEKRIAQMQEKAGQAISRLETDFTETKEQRAEKLFQKIIQM